MSLESVQTIIGRAVTEPKYRELLFSAPDKALKGYELTDEEAAALKKVKQEKFDAVVGELEKRISKVSDPMSVGKEFLLESGEEFLGPGVYAQRPKRTAR